MPPSKNINNYLHTKPVLDAALKHNGAEYVLHSHGQAMRWRAEAYMFRKLILETGVNDYQSLVLRVEGPKVIIAFRVVTGKLQTFDKKPIDFDKTIPDPEPNTFIIEATEFARSIDNEEET